MTKNKIEAIQQDKGWQILKHANDNTGDHCDKGAFSPSKRLTEAGIMLCQRRRRWPNTVAALIFVSCLQGCGPPWCLQITCDLSVNFEDHHTKFLFCLNIEFFEISTKKKLFILQIVLYFNESRIRSKLNRTHIPACTVLYLPCSAHDTNCDGFLCNLCRHFSMSPQFCWRDTGSRVVCFDHIIDDLGINLDPSWAGPPV